MGAPILACRTGTAQNENHPGMKRVRGQILAPLLEPPGRLVIASAEALRRPWHAGAVFWSPSGAIDDVNRPAGALWNLGQLPTGSRPWLSPNVPAGLRSSAAKSCGLPEIILAHHEATKTLAACHSPGRPNCRAAGSGLGQGRQTQGKGPRLRHLDGYLLKLTDYSGPIRPIAFSHLAALKNGQLE